MILKIKTFGFQNNCTRYEKNYADKIVYLKKIYKFTSEHFLIGHELSDLIVKNVIMNERFYFTLNLSETRTKCW